MTIKHDNVAIILGKLVKDAIYIQDSAKVTIGQPYDKEPKLKLSDDVLTIVFSSGRKKSKAVADKFIELSGGMGHMYAPQGGGGGAPKELNFMFGLLLTLSDGTEVPIYLGQGSNAWQRNNWWIGSPMLIDGKILGRAVVGASLKTEIGKAYDKLGSKIPVPFNHVHSFVGQLLFKDVFSSVNVFKIG